FRRRSSPAANSLGPYLGINAEDFKWPPANPGEMSGVMRPDAGTGGLTACERIISGLHEGARFARKRETDNRTGAANRACRTGFHGPAPGRGGRTAASEPGAGTHGAFPNRLGQCGHARPYDAALLT